ncbi:malto-oligosyltrehalose synthase [Acidisoma cellulosilytica]|uniref:Malto-oligosyltrehalose synthase n=1 Tax=Acidisoma cellulosilyticum TaxID=2802395 RepID=A0A963YX41_9PROT|nr:malto-oligosyltrehalose synthase [Acidisoma cellulosilyticum]MCB8878743.1 malto-oligosyltrehalose synthase [Acidisoma cellulosilyticum]
MAVPLAATYRLQFHKNFTFADAERQLPYLKRLGISHLYASPIQMSRPGSTHGYDGVDPSRIDPELGGEDGFRALADATKAAGLGMILDIVPNHLAVDSLNPLWMDALEFGPEGPAGHLFDIAWHKGQVIIPALGKTQVAAVADGEITLTADWEKGRLLARYFDNVWPLRPEAIAAALQMADARDEGSLAGLSQRFLRFENDGRRDLAAIAEARHALSELNPAHRALVEGSLARMDIAAVLHRQHWRLAHWRTESDSLTYRRFFNITGLIGVRVEDPAVFDLIHALPLRLLRARLVDGLRVDHVDGLADPTGYCARLRQEAGPEAILLVEKILGEQEALRDWPITGTTGYERLNDIQGLFVNPEGFQTLDSYLVRQRLLATDRTERLATAKSFMLRTSFLGEVETLTQLAHGITRSEPDSVEFGLGTLREAVIALLVRFPVYRGYSTDTTSDPTDAKLWQVALAGTEAHDNPWTFDAACALVRLLSQTEPGSPQEEFMRRFQQLSGPAMAKGLEDTEFYRSVALTAVNEVGGDIARPWRSIPEFHAIYAARAGAKAQDLIPLATHDTKRGPETRARIAALSEDAAGWIARFEAWHALNKVLRSEIAAHEAPDPIDEWLIYQTLVGTWPISEERLAEYLTKAMREAKRHTFWDNPNETYESAVQAFASGLLQDERAAGFRTALTQLVGEIDARARLMSLSMTVLQLTLPGSPDLYQGTEFWDFSLVDPDNRRPVDYAARAAALESTSLPRLAADKQGVTKLFVTQRLLALRQRSPDLFAQGSYTALDLPQPWFGFRRDHASGSLLVILPLGTEPAGKLADLPAAPKGQGWQPVLAAADGAIGLDPALPLIVMVSA